jgi:tetratricopeptide (TPR) repeat protein
MLGTIERPVDGTRAQDHHRQALDAAREAGADYPYNIALLGLAATAEHHGRPEDAIVHATQALAFANRSDYRVLQGRAHTSLASAYRAVGKEEPAAEHSRTATAIQRETGYRLDSRSAQPLQDDSVELA